jgi:putative PIN family toxin of toxin-antitoxin system
VKVVLDTNVVVSGTFYGGVPFEIVQSAKSGAVDLCVSAEIVAEYHEVLLRFVGPGSEADVAIILDALLENATVVATMELPSQISADRDDDVFIACALAAGADLIVSGDKHLLVLHGRIPVPVLKPREALVRIRTAT